MFKYCSKNNDGGLRDGKKESRKRVMESRVRDPTLTCHRLHIHLSSTSHRPYINLTPYGVE